MGIKEKIQRHRGGLLENTVMLYILQFSNMALGLVTQGYQMRVLGVELIGVLGAAQYATNFFQILIDFGFIYSATAKVSRFREDKNVLNKVLTCVILAKALFMALSFLILFVFIARFPCAPTPCCRTLCTAAWSRWPPSPCGPWPSSSLPP